MDLHRTNEGALYTTSIICLKCGSTGHTSAICKGPVTSFGLIIFAKLHPNANRKGQLRCGRMYPTTRVPCPIHTIKGEDNDGADGDDGGNGDNNGDNNSGSGPPPAGSVMFLLVERKDTVGFLNLVQGAYSDTSPYKERKVKRYLYELTCNERRMLSTAPFAELWRIAGSNKRDFKKAEKRLERLQIAELLDNNPCQFEEGDYLMPKGRLRKGETVQQCAIREFAEETGYSRSDVTLLDNMPSYEEHFIGADGKNYRNVFFVAEMKPDARILVRLGTDAQQSKEVRNIGWFTFPQCKRLIRSYHHEKLNMLADALRRIEKNV